jgi:transcriptional regulator with XRE-family HTH domain
MTKLKRILEDRKITQFEFGERIGVTQPFISHVITGKRRMPPDKAFLAEKEFGIPCEELVPWLGDLKQLAIKSAGGCVGGCNGN